MLYYCPGLREGIKKLYNLSKKKENTKEESEKIEEVGVLHIVASFTVVYFHLY